MAQLAFHESIITSLVKFGDSDCIARIFTKEYGRIAVFVKNGLEPRKSRGGILQAPSLAKIALKGYSKEKLCKLVQIDLDPKMFLLAARLKNLGYFCYFCELIEIFLPEHDANVDLFNLLLQSFNILVQEPSTVELLRSFELKLLANCGYLPDFSAALNESNEVVSFNPQTGSFSSQKIAGQLAFSNQACNVAIDLLHTKLNSLSKYDNEVLLMIARIFAYNLKQHGGNVKSIRFMQSII